MERYRVTCKLEAKFSDGTVNTETHRVSEIIGSTDFYSTDVSEVIKSLKNYYEKIGRKTRVEKDELYVYFDDCIYRFYNYSFLQMKDNKLLRTLRELNKKIREKRN